MTNEADREAERESRIALLRTELTDQSDRGVAIVGAAWVEDELQATLKETLLDDAAVAKDFFARVAFAHQINLARLLGIVTTEITADLHCIRDIRNLFAHNIATPRSNDALSFGTRDIHNRCLALHSIAYKQPTDPRDAFVGACIELTGSFVMQRFFVPRIVPNQFGTIRPTPIPPKVAR